MINQVSTVLLTILHISIVYLYYIIIYIICTYFGFIEEPVLKLVNETVINSPELELITNNELKNGDIVFCCYFEDFNHIYLCKSSSSKSIMPDNKNFIIDASKVKGNCNKIYILPKRFMILYS